MSSHSPFADEDRPLRDEAQYLIAQLRWPTTTDEQAVEETLQNYPYLTRNEISSWWRVGEFRRAVREAREVAKEYAAEDAGGSGPFIRTLGDPCEVPAEEAFASPVGERSNWWERWLWPFRS